MQCCFTFNFSYIYLHGLSVYSLMKMMNCVRSVQYLTVVLHLQLQIPPHCLHRHQRHLQARHSETIHFKRRVLRHSPPPLPGQQECAPIDQVPLTLNKSVALQRRSTTAKRNPVRPTRKRRVQQGAVRVFEDSCYQKAIFDIFSQGQEN